MARCWLVETLGLLACCTMLASPAMAQQPDRTVPGAPAAGAPSVSPPEVKFLQQAAGGDAEEIQLGQLAVSKTSNPAVKSFAERMVKDHSQSADQVQGIAVTEHVTLPTKLNPQQQAEKKKLSGLSGTQFDQQYMSYMVSEHTKDVDKFKQEAGQTQNATVKQFAQGTLPVLESHLQEAQQVEAKLQGKS